MGVCRKVQRHNHRGRIDNAHKLFQHGVIKQFRGNKLLFIITALLKLVAAALAIIAAAYSCYAAYNKYRAWRNWSYFSQESETNTFIGQFNRAEIDQAVAGYVVPHSSPVDPSNKDRDEFRADTRELSFKFFVRNIENSTKSFHLLLADTGMGKTSFCLNFYIYCKKRFKDKKVALISLASGDAVKRLSTILSKSETILILDALDEDPNAAEKGRERLDEILTAAADFKTVIITCRSQYFLSDDHIPYETPLPILSPKRAGQSPTFYLTRSYISPFDQKEIHNYIAKHFPIWKPWKIKSRKKAIRLASEIPDLSYRPMLLERLPELAISKTSSTELYDLYDYMVEGWIKRESRWIKPDDLRRISYDLALYIHAGFSQNSGRISPQEIEDIAVSALGVSPSWRYLTSRSLLNRDSAGRFKFAHKSILEFLIVKLAIVDERAWAIPWTPFMKDLFISWGYTEAGKRSRKLVDKILASTNGRKNIAPLVDMWATPPVNGLPDFKRSAKRIYSYSGRRLAPVAWRGGGVDISFLKDSDTWHIIDHEFNLKWNLIGKNGKGWRGHLSTIEILRINEKNSDLSLPSYDQFVALIEALEISKRSLLDLGQKFLIADRPSKTEHLVVCVGNIENNIDKLKIVDKDRKIGTTSRRISTYSLSLVNPHGYKNRMRYRQLWLNSSF